MYVLCFLGPPPTPVPCEQRIHDGVLRSHYDDHDEYSNNQDWCVVLQGDVSIFE